MKASEVITSRSRVELNDEKDPYTWLTRGLIVFLNDGVDQIVEWRPDALLADDGTTITVSDCTSISSNVSIATRWRRALNHYVCYRAFGVEGGDKYDAARSRNHWNAFVRNVRPDKAGQAPQ